MNGDVSKHVNEEDAINVMVAHEKHRERERERARDSFIPG